MGIKSFSLCKSLSDDTDDFLKLLAGSRSATGLKVNSAVAGQEICASEFLSKVFGRRSWHLGASPWSTE